MRQKITEEAFRINVIYIFVANSISQILSSTSQGTLLQFTRRVYIKNHRNLEVYTET
jgi:hypothetical protein